VKTGSRNETLETSGTTHYLEKLLTRGTAAKNK